MFPLKMVIFHSYVSLPEGKVPEHPQSLMESPPALGPLLDQWRQKAGRIHLDLAGPALTYVDM